MDNIIAYFNGEKLQCIISALLSIAFITICIFLIFQQKVFLKGIAYAGIPLALLLLIVCFGVIYKNSTDIERVTTFYKEAPQKIKAEEVPRMEQVMKSFGTIKKVEIAIFIIGLVLTVIFWQNELIRGVGIGLILMGASLYAFDHIAESRGESYILLLKTL
jgi:hypothetical protein